MTERTNAIEALDEDDTSEIGMPPANEGLRRGGRPKGSQNRITLVMREAIAAVFEDLQSIAAAAGKDGRYPDFLEWAKDNRTVFYQMAAKRIPMSFEAAGEAIGLVVFKGINDGSDDVDDDEA